MANRIKFKAPVLPTPPQQYNQSLFQRTFSILRLYFNQIDNQFRENLNNPTIDGTCDITGNTTVGGTLTVAGATTLNGATTVNNDLLKVVSTDAGATENPILALYRNSSSIAVSDEIGAVEFRGNDAEGAEFVYGRIYSELSVVGSGSEQANLRFAVGASGGIEDPVMMLRQYALEIIANNDLYLQRNSQIQFEGSNANSHETVLYVVDPTQDNTVLLPNLSGTLPVLEASNSATYFEITNDDAGATAKPVLSLYRNSASPATNEDMGAIRFFGNNASGEKVFYAGIDGASGSSVADGSHVGKIVFYLADGTSSGGAVTDPSADITTDEDPVMSLFKYGLVMRAGNDIFLGNQNDCLEWQDTGSHEQKLQGRQTETSGGDSLVSMPDANQGVLEIGALGTGAVVTGTSITHANFTGYRGQKVVFTGSSNCTIQLPDVAAGDVGATWTVCNAGSANVIFDLNGSGSAQTLKILTGAAVTTVGTDDPHIIPGGVASLVCTAADNYILFGSGVVDN